MMLEPSKGYMRAIGYHGTSGQALHSILDSGFVLSQNDYDWLGDGIYFFQDAPAHAWDWARAHHHSDGAVVAAEIDLSDCIDLLDTRWTTMLTEAYNGFLAYMKKSGLSIPTQSAGAHRLDRYVINYLVGILNKRGSRIGSVRAAFREGAPIFPNSALFDRAHVQIAVRDPGKILRVWAVSEEVSDDA